MFSSYSTKYKYTGAASGAMSSFQSPAAMTEWEAHLLSRICAGESLFFPDDARLKIQQLFQALDSRRTGKLEATDFQVIHCVQ